MNDVDPRHTVPANLRAEMARSNIGPSELADRVGVARNTVQRWRDGRSAMDTNTLSLVAAVLDCRVADLVETRVPA